MFPPAISTNREAVEDVTVEVDGQQILIPKVATVHSLSFVSILSTSFSAPLLCFPYLRRVHPFSFPLSPCITHRTCGAPM